MRTEFDMEEVWLPIGAGPEDPRCNIFLSPGALEKEKLILLIQGSGAVRLVAPPCPTLTPTLTLSVLLSLRLFSTDLARLVQTDWYS